MTYTIHWSKKAEKFLETIPKEHAKRIATKVDSIKEDPYHYIEHFEGEFYFKLRIGDYRVLLDINPSSKLIEIRLLGHRRNVYKQL